VKHGNYPDKDEFEKITKPVVEWFQRSCNPHQQIVIQMDGAELLSGEMGYTVEVPD
jgi:hypothetical protein